MTVISVIVGSTREGRFSEIRTVLNCGLLRGPSRGRAYRDA